MSLSDAPICLSGGAKGADQQWGMTAGLAGHSVFHFTFAGHRAHVPESEIVILSQDKLDLADPYLEIANKTLQRRVPYGKPFVCNLLRRNWYQVRDAGSVYAVAGLQNGLVTGGTAWAVQMFLDRHEAAPCAAYVFDQAIGRWHRWDGAWIEIDSPPVPEGVWAGIGSRDLLDVGKTAIRTLMNYTPQTTSETKSC